MAYPDWVSIGDRLYAETRAAFVAFSRKHPGELCSHVAYHTEPHNGYMLLGFDTPVNSLRVAERYQQERLPHTREMLERAPWQQEDAHRFLKSHSLLPLNLSSAELAFPEEVIWEFPEWTEFADSEDYPPSTHNDYESDYLRAALALCLWRLVERLVKDYAFDDLPMAQPCLVSYQDHDDVLVGLRVLNWPSGPRR